MYFKWAGSETLNGLELDGVHSQEFDIPLLHMHLARRYLFLTLSLSLSLYCTNYSKLQLLKYITFTYFETYVLLKNTKTKQKRKKQKNETKPKLKYL